MSPGSQKIGIDTAETEPFEMLVEVTFHQLQDMPLAVAKRDHARRHHTTQNTMQLAKSA